MKELLLSTFNASAIAYVAWFSYTLTEAEGVVKVATGLLVFAYTCWRWYRDYKKNK